jgi:hypothetical protein
VLWLGGSPCAGKSTVAALLAERHGLRLYSCDAHFDRHSAAADPATQPTLARLRAAPRAEQFLQLLRALVRDAVSACREEFPMVVADLVGLPPGSPILAEGMTLLPECVAGLRPERAAWLVPSPAFQRAHYARREWATSLLEKLPDPERVFENWMLRDEVSARWVRVQARRFRLPVSVVDHGYSIAAVTSWVEARLGL